LLRLVATGRLDPTPLVTHRFPFTDVIEALRMTADRRCGVIKPVVVFR
jgi:isopropanol dehydrogenase (NADP+)